MNMLIAATASATPRKGYAYHAVMGMMDIANEFLDGSGSEEKLDRMMKLLDSGQPVTTAMLRTAKPVVPAKTMASVTDDYWRKQEAKRSTGQKLAPASQQPSSPSTATTGQRPAPVERLKPVTSIDADAVYRKWNSVKRRT
jgi:hypothetical protein